MWAIARWGRWRRGEHPGAGRLLPVSVVGAAGPRRSAGSLVETALSSGQPLVKVERTQADGRTHCIAQGYERVETVTAQLDGVACSWTERRLLVQSMAAKLAAEQALHTRLQQAQQALSELVMRRQGKACSRPHGGRASVADTLAHFRVEGLLLVTVTEQVQEQAVRAYRDRPATVRIIRHFRITSQVQTEALRKASEQLGWRVYKNQNARSIRLLIYYSSLLLFRRRWSSSRNQANLQGIG